MIVAVYCVPPINVLPGPRVTPALSFHETVPVYCAVEIVVTGVAPFLGGVIPGITLGNF